MSKASKPSTVSLLAETVGGERRVALTPGDLRRFKGRATFLIQRGAGERAGFSDAAYASEGAELVELEAALSRADITIAVRAPKCIGEMVPGTTLISLGAWDTGFQKQAAQHAVQHLALERMPRTTRAQSMDVLSSQAAIAGYAAVIEGARALNVLIPMMTTAGGGIKPAKMIALGAGVAGLQAIATARRLGAVVHGFDVREAAREQVESLGARFVSPEVLMPAGEISGGYAAEQSREQQQSLRQTLQPVLAGMNLVISSAQIPGRPAPLLIDYGMIAEMTPGTVILDMAAESGGNVSATQPDREISVRGVRVLGPTNLPSLMATDASRLFGGNIRALLEHLLDDEGHLRLLPTDHISKALLGAQAPAIAA